MFFDALLNSYKVRFMKLDKLFSDVEVKSVVDEVNIFINLESIYSLFHNRLIEEKLTSLEKPELSNHYVDMVSGIVNIAAHYRLFFTKNKIKSNIVFYYNPTQTYSKYNSIMYNDSYRSKYVEKYSINPAFELCNMLIQQSAKNIKDILFYIDSSYLIYSDRIESSVIPLTLVNEKKLDGKINIMITKDMYDLQYANKNFLIIYPDKEDSKMITKNNLFKFVKQKEECDNEFELPPYLYSFMLSVIGDKKRSIPKLKGVGFTTIYKNLSKLYRALDIDVNEFISFEQLASSIKEDEMFPNKNKERVVKNYMTIDIDRQYNIISDTQKINLYEQIVDKYDPEELKKMNDKYFEFSPIHIMELNNYYSKKKERLF